jgi:hypothetical protein
MKKIGNRILENSKHEFRNVYAQPPVGDFEVPVGDWERFLETFTNQHQCWLVNVFTTPAGKRYEKFPQIIGRPLTRVCIDRKRSRPEVQISVVGSDIEPYRVPDPARIVFKQDSEGAHEGLDVTSADGSATSVRFRVSARPETLDGVLAMLQKAKAKCAGWRIPLPAM